MPEKKILCPLMNSPCIEDGDVRDGQLMACRFWIKVQGRHPQSGVTVDHHDCSINWMPILMMENSKVNRETGAAVESMRNEVQTANTNLLTSLAISRHMGGQLRPAPTPIESSANSQLLLNTGN